MKAKERIKRYLAMLMTFVMICTNSSMTSLAMVIGSVEDVIPTEQSESVDDQWTDFETDFVGEMAESEFAEDEPSWDAEVPAAVAVDQIVITGDTVNVRSDASKDSQVLFTVGKGTTLPLVDIVSNGTDSWFVVQTDNGIGYVFGTLAEVVYAEPETETEEVQTESAEETESETAIETEVETEAETVIETEVETEAETAIETEVETESETAIETEVETEAETAIDTEVETESETAIETETETESEEEILATETESESETGTETESETESEIIVESETE